MGPGRDCSGHSNSLRFITRSLIYSMFCHLHSEQVAQAGSSTGLWGIWGAGKVPRVLESKWGLDMGNGDGDPGTLTLLHSLLPQRARMGFKRRLCPIFSGTLRSTSITGQPTPPSSAPRHVSYQSPTSKEQIAGAASAVVP